MANSSKNPLGFLFGTHNVEAKELTADLIKIRGSTVLLTDKIINIQNIALIEVVPLTMGFPWIAPFFLLAGLSAFLDGGLIALLRLFFDPWNRIFFVNDGLIALFKLAIGGWGLYLLFEYVRRLSARGLLILLNSGVDSSILLKDIDINFLKQIALTLYNIISTGNERNLDIYVDQKNITEVSIAEISNSVISTGTVSGSLVNMIK